MERKQEQKSEKRKFDQTAEQADEKPSSTDRNKQLIEAIEKGLGGGICTFMVTCLLSILRPLMETKTFQDMRMPCAQDYLNVLENEDIMSYFEWKANCHGIAIPKYIKPDHTDSSLSPRLLNTQDLQKFLRTMGFCGRLAEQYSEGLSLESFYRSVTELSEPCVFLVGCNIAELSSKHVSLWITTRNAEGILICSEWHNWKNSPHTPPSHLQRRTIIAVYELAVYYRKQLASRAGAAAGK